jgi:hypothetical protein
MRRLIGSDDDVLREGGVDRIGVDEGGASGMAARPDQCR